MVRLLVALEKARAGAPGVLLQLVALVLVLAWARFGTRLSPRARRGADLALVAATLASTGLAAVDALENVRYPRPWDFPSFYAVADAAAHGRSFYDPGVLADVQARLTRTQHVPGEWTKELGYWYLPPSVFLIWPLGWFGFRQALVLQYLTQGLFLLGSAWLLARRLPLGGGARGFAAVMLVLTLFLPVQSTLELAQIVFGCLFCLLAAEALMDRAPVVAGLCLAVGIYYKHLLMIPALVLLVGRDRRARIAGASAVAGAVAALAVSLVVLGRGILSEWATQGVGTRQAVLAIDPVVQSLMALLYRALHVTPHGSLIHVILWPPFAACGAALALATLVALWRAEPTPRARRLGFWLVAALAVLCYPNTLISTLALVAPIALVAYADVLEGGGPWVAALAVPLVTWALAGLLPRESGWAALLLWSVLWWRLMALAPGRPTATAPAAGI